MNFPGFMFGFLMLRVLAKKYVGDLSNFASESIAAASDMIKRSVSFGRWVPRLVQANPLTTLLDNL